MNGGTGLEGAVTVALAVAGDTVHAARVTVNRPTAAGRALAGRTVADALRLIPLLYSVCGTAQGVAAVGAVENALGGTPSPAQQTARDLLMLGETAVSHAWQACVDWPRLLNVKPRPGDLAAVRAAVADLMPALYPRRDALTPGGGHLRPDVAVLSQAVERLRGAVARTLFGTVAPPRTADELASWSGGAPPASRMLCRVLEPDMVAFGACDVAPLADHPAAWFAERLAADPGFSAHPHDDGRPALLGPLARMIDHPEIAPLVARHGTGVAAHVTARTVELADLPDRMAALLPGLAPADPVPVTATGGAGAAVVETARGRLAHWARIVDGRIADYRTVAPTEWNFAPDGPLARGLTGAPAGPDLPERAALLVAALDPCVQSFVTVEEG